MSEYKVNKVNLKSEQYTLYVFTIPQNELNDKLTYFTHKRGMIPKSLYYDFLIATCVSNIQQFLEYLQTKNTDLKTLNSIRMEIIDHILENNPCLQPDNIVVNSNHVVKAKEWTDDDGNLVVEEGNPITGSDFWKKDFYEDGEKMISDVQNKRLDLTKVQHIGSLPYTVKQKFWRRLGEYIDIKCFEPGSELVILGQKNFERAASFKQYIVTVCIVEVEDLFVHLDSSGLPNRIPSHKLIHELYEICVSVNPFLSYEVYRDTLSDEELENLDNDQMNPFDGVQRASRNEPGPLASKMQKKTKLFKDVKRETLLSLDKSIKKKVIGQNEPIEQLVDAIQRASVGLKDPEQPIGTFIFTGATGIGKTYTAKILAEELTGNRNSLITIDCSEYSADHEYAKLIGAPSGYIGHENGGYLTNALTKNPFSVVLFDEIEKASDRVHQLMLQIMEEARLTDGKGNTVSFKDAVIIMTSNLGVKETQQITKTIGFGDVAMLDKEKQQKAIKESLKKKFKPEFLNRITTMINFGNLNKRDYKRIIKLELEKLKVNLKLNRTQYSKLNVTFDKSLYEYIYKVGIDENYGARPLKRAIEQHVSTPLARKLLKENIDCDTTSITVSTKKGEVLIETECTVDEPPFFMEVGNGDE